MENQININNSLEIYALASTAEGIQWLKQRTVLFDAPTNLTLNDDGLVQIRYDNDIVGEVPPWIMADNANRMRLSLRLSKAKFAAKFNVTSSSQISFLFSAANFFDSANAVLSNGTTRVHSNPLDAFRNSSDYKSMCAFMVTSINGMTDGDDKSRFLSCKLFELRL